MSEIIVTVGSSVGLHARPAALFTKAAARQTVSVTISKDGGVPVNAGSILSVIGLDARGGDQVELRAEGDGAEQALDELAAVLAENHDDANQHAGN